MTTLSRHHRRWRVLELAWAGVFVGSMLLSCSCIAIKYTGKRNIPKSSVAVVPVHKESLEPQVARVLEDRKAVSGSLTPADVYATGVANWLMTSFTRECESGWFREVPNVPERENWPAELPRTCLALSGGGIRSAAFAAGVLQGLNDENLLDAVDVIGSVSGGGYAHGWYLASKFRGEQAPAPFDLAHYDRLQHEGERFISNTGAAIGAAIDHGLILVGNLFVPRTLGARLNYPSSLYSTRIGSVFLKKGKNTPTLAKSGCPQDKTPTLAELSCLQGKTPYPVLLSTALADDRQVCVKTDDSLAPLAPGACRDPHAKEPCSMATVAFELAPLRTGNPTLGFSDKGNWLELAHALATSGAATDTTTSGFCPVIRALNFEVGAKVPVLPGAPFYRVGSDEEKLWTKAVRTHELHLIDGGQVDNLGVFPLVQRLCGDILIADAEFDPDATFGAYSILKEELKRLHLTLTDPDIDQHLLGRDTQGRALAPCADPPQMVSDELPLPVVTQGTIGPIPYIDPSYSPPNEPVAERTLSVWYMKLAINGDLIQEIARIEAADYSDEPFSIVVDEVCKARTESARIQGDENEARKFCDMKLGGLGTKCQFPHHPTTKQSLSYDTFRAYRLLGRAEARLTARRLKAKRSRAQGASHATY